MKSAVRTIVIENLPEKYTEIMVQEMLRNFEGRGTIDMAERTCHVQFEEPSAAQLAVAGKNYFQ